MECLGLIGAIDPVKLQFDEQNSQNTLSAESDILSDDFCIEFLTKLYKSYMHYTNVAHQDCIMYAVQELIKIFKITPTKKNKVWSSLSKDVQEVFLPLTSSK